MRVALSLVAGFAALALAAAAALAALALLAGAARATPVTGVVADHAGKPIEFATVAVPALKLGAITDDAGRFALDLPPGRHVIEVTQLGYERARIEVAVDGRPAALSIALADQPVELSEVSVTASSFGKTGRSEGATLRRMDVVMTPGGAADVFQSLRSLPGINAPDDGAAVYVRGGPPDETLIRLDGGEIGHPYHYEGASGGLFSAFDAYMLKSAFFSSGGFSAKYGGVLSGVLDIETSDPMNLKTVSLGANLVGGGLSTSWALIPDRLSAVAALRATNTDLLFRLYGTSREFETAPNSQDGAVKLLYRYSRTGRLALTGIGAGDHTDVVAKVLNFSGAYRERARNELGTLHFSDLVAGRVALRGQMAGQYYRNRWTYGPFGAVRTERNAQANLDAVAPLGPRHELSLGMNARRRGVEIGGSLAADSTDYQPGAPARPITTRAALDYPGFYVEDKMRVGGPLYATAGARFDWLSTARVWTADPRAALAYRVDDHQWVRIAAGRYHQPADARYLDPVYGNPRLGALEADHVIAGYEWTSDQGNVRVEAYRKNYRDLVTNSAATFYANGGHGDSRGVDLFARGAWHWLSGWLSYGYMEARRKELDDPRLVRAKYGVRHSLTLVGTYSLNPALQIGGRYGFSTGRTYTPVIGRSYDAARGIWRPILGENNSGQLPDYHRLDIRLTRLFSIPRGMGLRASSVCAAYAEVMNALGTRNVLEYTYSPDYSERYERETYFARRLIVTGVALTW
jgi:hypothetical protein